MNKFSICVNNDMFKGSLKDRSSDANDIDFYVSLSILIYDDGGDNRCSI